MQSIGGEMGSVKELNDSDVKGTEYTDNCWTFTQSIPTGQSAFINTAIYHKN